MLSFALDLVWAVALACSPLVPLVVENSDFSEGPIVEILGGKVGKGV